MKEDSNANTKIIEEKAKIEKMLRWGAQMNLRRKEGRKEGRGGREGGREGGRKEGRNEGTKERTNE